jgi:Domain of unknown function (DUF4190)
MREAPCAGTHSWQPNMSSQPASSSAPAPPLPSTTRVNKMAIASLALSFLGFIPPSVVTGHMSRRQIMSSQGRQKGMGIAYAGLILSYLQLIVAALLFVVLIGRGYEMNQKLGNDRYVRAALVERMINGDPDHPSAAVMAKNGENLMDSLHLIEARQDAYRAEHDGNYACHLNYLEPLGRDDELAVHVRNSHYGIRVICTGMDDRGRAGRYAASAYPDNESNPPNAPVYCVDEKKTTRRYTAGTDVGDVALYQHQSCPENGAPVE